MESSAPLRLCVKTLCVSILCALCVDARGAAAAAPRIVLELPPGSDNPRNSEGTFATLRDGRVMFAYTRFSTGIRDGIPDSGAAEIVARLLSTRV